MRKAPKTGFMRGNVLSKDLAMFDGKPIVLRMMKKSILTAASRSSKITRDEAHYLAAMSLYAGNREPLT